MNRRWKQDVNEHDVSKVAAQLGLDAGERGSWGPCPGCGAETRGKDDRRGPIGQAGRGWQCWRDGCLTHDGARDPVGLVALVELGTNVTATLASAQWEQVRLRAVAAGLCDDTPDVDTKPRPWRRPMPRRPRRPSLGELVALDEARANADEARDLWDRGMPVYDDMRVVRWLLRRGLDPKRIAGLDLVRALPAEALPAWARHGRAEWSRGWRALLPCYGPSGALVRVRARWVPRARDDWQVKTSGGTGLEVGGCVYADPLAVKLLGGGSSERWDQTVLVVEGGPAFLHACLDRPLSGRTHAVIGVFSGAWRDTFASRFRRCGFVLATDHGKAGDAYAAAIRKTLHPSCPAVRCRPDADGWDDMALERRLHLLNQAKAELRALRPHRSR
jgi:hypothetical protein